MIISLCAHSEMKIVAFHAHLLNQQTEQFVYCGNKEGLLLLILNTQVMLQLISLTELDKLPLTIKLQSINDGDGIQATL